MDQKANCYVLMDVWTDKVSQRGDFAPEKLLLEIVYETKKVKNANVSLIVL